MFHVVLHNPVIPPNTGNVIRTTAVSGATLHLVEPLGFSLDDAHLRRAGLDYHDMTHVLIHPDFHALVAALANPDAGRPGGSAEPWAASALGESGVADGGAARKSAVPGVRPTGRIFAFTGQATTSFTDVRYQPGDALLLGTEPTGLPPEVLADPRVTELVRIPMVPGARSLNLSNAAAIALYEAWRQNDFAGGV